MTTPLVTRYPGGICDATQDGVFGQYAGTRPFRYYTWKNDFDNFVAGDWVVTTAGGTGTEAISATGDGGWLVMTAGATGTTADLGIQWAGNSGAVVKPVTFDTTKDLFLQANFKVSDATNAGVLVGLAVAATAAPSTLPTDGIFFYKAAAAKALVAVVRVGSSSTTIALGNMADDTFVNVAMAYTAVDGLWRAYVADVLQTGSFATAALGPTAALGVSIAQFSGATGAAIPVLSTDFLFVAKQR